MAYKNQHATAAEDIQSYLANPINAYLLVKRLTTDWKQVENLMNTNVGQGIFEVSILFNPVVLNSIVAFILFRSAI